MGFGQLGETINTWEMQFFRSILESFWKWFSKYDFQKLTIGIGKKHGKNMKTPPLEDVSPTKKGYFPLPC